MFGVGGQELLVILFIILILFGADKVPKLAKGMGEAVREFRNAVKGAGEDGTENTGNGQGGSKKNDIGGAFQGTAQAASVLPWRGGSLCGPLRHLLEGFIRKDSHMAHALL